MATLRILSAVYDFNQDPSVGKFPKFGPRRLVHKALVKVDDREGFQHSTKLRKWSALVFLLVAILAASCRTAEPPRVQSDYVSGRTRLEFPAKGKFKITFDAASPWAAFGPLEGETSQSNTLFVLHPKTLNGSTEEQIQQQAMKLAQEQGIRTDLEGVRVLMKTVQTEIDEEKGTLKVTEPASTDPDKHPLAGATLSSGL